MLEGSEEGFTTAKRTFRMGAHYVEPFNTLDEGILLTQSWDWYFRRPNVYTETVTSGFG